MLNVSSSKFKGGSLNQKHMKLMNTSRKQISIPPVPQNNCLISKTMPNSPVGSSMGTIEKQYQTNGDTHYVDKVSPDMLAQIVKNFILPMFESGSTRNLK